LPLERQLPSMNTLMGELSFDDAADAADEDDDDAADADADADDDDAVGDSNDDDDGGMSIEYKDFWVVAAPTTHAWAAARAAAGS
jgi:hypothetical protein